MVYTKNDQKSINFLNFFDFWSFFRYTKEDERRNYYEKGRIK